MSEHPYQLLPQILIELRVAAAQLRHTQLKLFLRLRVDEVINSLGLDKVKFPVAIGALREFTLDSSKA
jgi:hypothetical protein